MCFARTHVAVQFLICCMEVSNSKTFVTDGTCGTLSPNAGIHDFQHGPWLSTSHRVYQCFFLLSCSATRRAASHPGSQCNLVVG